MIKSKQYSRFQKRLHILYNILSIGEIVPMILRLSDLLRLYLPFSTNVKCTQVLQQGLRQLIISHKLNGWFLLFLRPQLVVKIKVMIIFIAVAIS